MQLEPDFTALATTWVANNANDLTYFEVCIPILEKKIGLFSIKLYIFARASLGQKLKGFTGEGRPDTVVEVWVRSVQCSARGVRSKCLFFSGGKGHNFFQ